jgi:twinfilin-like protein
VQSLITSTSQRGLLATIKDEQIIPGPTIASSSSSFTSDLSNLSTHVKPNEALYILLRRANELSSSDKSLCAITYVPNAAPVRQKMLFASTRLTLLRELGGEHFPETVFCTEADELTEKGWERHLAHEKEGNPLTKEEKDLEDIKQAEALESRGTQGHSLTQGGKLALRTDNDIASALQTLGQGGSENLVQLRMDGKTETLQLASVSSSSPSQLATAIDGSEPRFSFYRWEDAESSIVFVSTCPSKAKIKDRMLYAASRSNVLLLAQNEGGLKVAKRIEATNPEEITEQVLKDEFKVAQVEEKKSFAKPKRPGRK